MCPSGFLIVENTLWSVCFDYDFDQGIGYEFKITLKLFQKCLDKIVDVHLYQWVFSWLCITSYSSHTAHSSLCHTIHRSLCHIILLSVWQSLFMHVTIIFIILKKDCSVTIEKTFHSVLNHDHTDRFTVFRALRITCMTQELTFFVLMDTCILCEIHWIKSLKKFIGNISGLKLIGHWVVDGLNVTKFLEVLWKLICKKILMIHV